VPRRPLQRLVYYIRMLPLGLAPVLCLVAVILGGVVFWQFLYQSPYFEARHWVVTGAMRLDEEEVVRAARGAVRDPLNLLLYSCGEAEERLALRPPVREARVTRRWPETVEIEVRERQPRALLIGRERAFVVDVEGVVLDLATPAELLDSQLPVFTGPAGRAWEPGQRMDPDFRDAAYIYSTILASSGSIWLGSLSEVHWEPDTGATLYMENGARLVCGRRPPGEALAAAEALAHKLGGLALVDYADLRMQSHVAWKPREEFDAGEADARIARAGRE